VLGPQPTPNRSNSNNQPTNQPTNQPAFFFFFTTNSSTAKLGSPPPWPSARQQHSTAARAFLPSHLDTARASVLCCAPSSVNFFAVAGVLQHGISPTSLPILFSPYFLSPLFPVECTARFCFHTLEWQRLAPYTHTHTVSVDDAG